MEIFERFNTLVGVIIGCNNFGCYVRDEKTDKVVFYYGCGQKGDRVQLTIKKINPQKEQVTCVLDSVISYIA